MSAQLLFTQMALASADLPGEMGSSALAATLYVVPMIVGLLRMIILRCLLFKVGHAKNDLRVLPKEPETCIGRFQKSLTFLPSAFFSSFCSFVQCFQLQSSKVSSMTRGGSLQSFKNKISQKYDVISAESTCTSHIYQKIES